MNVYKDCLNKETPIVHTFSVHKNGNFFKVTDQPGTETPEKCKDLRENLIKEEEYIMILIIMKFRKMS